MKIFTSFVLIFGCAVAAAAQSNSGEKFSDAIRRSQESAKIISSIAELPTGGIPKKVFDKAQAVAVFPNVTTQKLLMQKAIKGRGVVSVRGVDGWTMPAYYNFAGPSAV